MDETTNLQFERAEFTAGVSAAACGFCKQDILATYYQVNGAVACASCRQQLQAALDGSGSSAGRFARAVGAGTAAAIGGALLYYAISALTGYEFALISIVVGVAVGKAVRWGSGGRGGWRYQALAMTLTYLAIVATYVPPLIKAIREEPDKVAAATVQGAAAPAAPAPAAAQPPAASAEPPSLGRALVAVALLVGLICAMPFLAGAQNIIGLIIIGIGMYEAWKITRRTSIAITGPHLLARAGAVVPTA